LVKSPGMLKTPGIKPLFLVILILAILLAGCTDYVKQIQDQFTQSSDPVLRRAEPYIGPIDTENATLRALAVSIVNGGPYGDKEYQINKMYRYIVDNTRIIVIRGAGTTSSRHTRPSPYAAATART